MNQKEFELIAKIVKQQWQKTVKRYGSSERSFEAQVIALRFADKLEQEYPKTFDRDKFLRACGI